MSTHRCAKLLSVSCVLMTALGGSGCTPEPEPTADAKCNSNNDCSVGYVCDGGECAKLCGDPKDCEEGFFCSQRGVCLSSELDEDNDGFSRDLDCNDDNADINPDMPELCNDVDDNCNGIVDEQAKDATTWYADFDNDDYGSAIISVDACTAPAGYTDNAQDCDGFNPDTYPDAPELCDGKDNDCTNGVPANETTRVFADADGDGYGNPNVALLACEAPASFVTDSSDCDDTNPQVHPGQDEIPGDGVANDCQGTEQPHLVFVTERRTGNLFAFNRTTGELAWQRSDLGGMTDLAYGTGGILYVRQLEAGTITAVHPDGSSEVLLQSTDGSLFFDHANGTLLVATGEKVLEVNPDGSSMPLVEGLDGSAAHAVRLAWDANALYISFDDSSGAFSRVSRYDLESENWDHIAYLDADIRKMVPARDRSLLVSSVGGRVFRVTTWNGQVEPLASTSRIAGICPDVRGDDILVGTHDSELLTLQFQHFSPPQFKTIRGDLAEPWDCATNRYPDQDGDGFISMRLGGRDCNDHEPQMHPDAADPGGDGIDQNCDGPDGIDADGDGNTSEASGGTDCNDDDASVYWGAGCGEPADCAAVLDGFPRAPTGRYEIFPDTVAEFTAFCEMGHAGGGWTLISNRRGGDEYDNKEKCADKISTFFTGGCGRVDNIGADDSYALTSSKRAALEPSQYLVLQFLDGVPDVDDAYIITTDGSETDLFPDANGLKDIGVASACDVYGENCDTSGVYWKYIGKKHYSSSQCNADADTTSPYFGNYGICGANNSNQSSGLFGDRNGYDETKLWGYDSKDAQLYQERIFVR